MTADIPVYIGWNEEKRLCVLCMILKQTKVIIFLSKSFFIMFLSNSIAFCDKDYLILYDYKTNKSNNFPF